jgi:hypothetical protein
MGAAKRRQSVHSQTQFSANDDMQLHGMHWYTNWCTTEVSIGEQLPEDDVSPKHVAIKCDFNYILK